MTVSSKYMMTHDELKQSALEKPEVQAAYEALESEFALLRQMVQARQLAEFPQVEVAQDISTKPTPVASLE